MLLFCLPDFRGVIDCGRQLVIPTIGVRTCHRMLPEKSSYLTASLQTQARNKRRRGLAKSNISTYIWTTSCAKVAFAAVMFWPLMSSQVAFTMFASKSSTTRSDRATQRDLRVLDHEFNNLISDIFSDI
jgi:hypothetical protein